MTTSETFDRRYHRLCADHGDRCTTFNDRLAALKAAYARATDVDEAVRLDLEREQVARELAAVRVVHGNASNALLVARHEAVRREQRIEWLRKAIATAEAIIRAGRRSDTTRQAEIDLRTWRPALAELEAQEAEALRALGVEPAATAANAA